MIRYLLRFLRVYQGFVVSGAILLFCAVAFVFAVVPGIRATKALYDDLRDLEGQTKALSSKLTFLGSLHEEDLRDQVVLLLTAVPQEKSVPTILSSVEGLADQTGVTIDDMSLTSPGSLATGSAARAGSLSFTLNASGMYEKVRAFVGGINKVRRLFDVASFDISTTGTGVTTVRLSLTAFYQPLPTNVGSVQAPVAALSQKDEEVLGVISQYPDVSQSRSDVLTPMFSEGKRDPFAR